MYTSRNKVWSRLPASPPPNKDGVGSGGSNPRNGDRSNLKGKNPLGCIEGQPSSPPMNSLEVNGGMNDGGGGGGNTRGDAEVWRRFKEEGLLDKALLEKKDREALVEKIMKLEKELFDYQYNMGLLLIEKKRRSSDYDGLRQALAEAHGSLKQQQAAHLITLSEVEKREQNLWKALGVEKQCVADLEKALHEMHTGSSDIKRTFHRKIDEANGLVASIEAKSLDIKVKLAEVSQNSSQLGRKLKDVEEIDAVSQKLEMKEKDLLALEEKLDDRDDMEVQKLLGEHNLNLGSTDQQGQKEIDTSKLIGVEQKEIDTSKLIGVEQKEIDSIHKDKKIGKREEALAKKLEKCKEKEKEFESKHKVLREREKSLKAAEKDVETEKKQMVTDRETLQSELKQKIDKCVVQEELILKEREDLKQDRENFEREWEILDEKRSEVAKELKQVCEEKETLEQLKHSVEERMNEKLVTQDNVQKELEALRLEKESVSTYMEHERKVFLEQAQIEHDRMLQDLELQKAELEANMQNKLEEMENHLLEKERAFEKEKQRELKNINYLKDVAGKELATNKKHLEEKHVEIRKDISKLHILVKKLKDQREQCKMFVEKLKSCKICEEVINEFVLSDLQSFQEIGDTDVLPSPATDYVKERIDGTLPIASERQNEDASTRGSGLVSSSSVGNMSWLRKCTSKIFKASPLKRNDHAVSQGLSEELHVPITQVDMEASTGLDATENKTDTDFQITRRIREFESEPTLSVDAQSNMDGKAQETEEDTRHSELKIGRGRKPDIKRRPRGRKAQVVLEDDELIFMGSPEENNADEHSYGNREDNIDVNGDSIFYDKGAATGRKRSHAHASRTTSEQDAYNSEAHSDSATTGGRRKRQQIVVLALETPAGQRYNLRRPKSASKATACLDKGKKKNTSRRKTAVDPSLEIAGENGKHAPLMQTTITSIVEFNELPSEKFVRFETSKQIDGNNASATKLIEDKEFSEGVIGSTEAVEYVDDNEYGSEVSGEFLYGEEDEEDEDYDYEHQDEVSIGKKLWTFFTT